jgi:two-component system alkaline phosphatase synthesis response regulator PhoP
MQLKQTYKILLVDSNPDTLELLQQGLVSADCRPDDYLIENLIEIKDLLDKALAWHPDLVLLEMPPLHTKTLELGRIIKEHPELTNTLLVYLAVQPTEHTEVEAFDAGADGYLAKPIRPRALMGRIRSMLNRRDNNFGEAQKIALGNFTLDKATQKIFRGVQLVPVAQKEFELLFFLAQHPNKIFKREELIHEVWGNDASILTRTVDVHIHKLREKIGDDYISTVKGLGYRLNWKLK